MVKLIKQIKLNRPMKAAAANSDPTRGTAENPYTTDEMYSLYYACKWTGGWVETFGLLDEELNLVAEWVTNGSLYPSDYDPFAEEEEENNPNNTPADEDNEPAGGDAGFIGGGGGNTDGGDNTGGDGTGGGGHNDGNGDNNGHMGGTGNPGKTYMFDESGYCTIISNNNGTYAINANGSILYISGPLLGYPADDFSPNNSGIMEFRGTMTIFRHLADNIAIEWAASYNSEDDAVISTTHQEANGDTNSIMGYINHIHSHPNGYKKPSDTDINTWIGMYKDYMRNFLGDYTTNDTNYGKIYQNFMIYVVNEGQGSSENHTEEDVMDYFKNHATYNDKELWKRYKNYLKVNKYGNQEL